MNLLWEIFSVTTSPGLLYIIQDYINKVYTRRSHLKQYWIFSWSTVTNPTFSLFPHYLSSVNISPISIVRQILYGGPVRLSAERFNVTFHLHL